MVKGVCGLKHVPTMMDEVEAAQPFGSFFAFAELESSLGGNHRLCLS